MNDSRDIIAAMASPLRASARRNVVCAASFCCAVGLGLPRLAWAASLPAHDPLQILLVSDEVNPHGLTPEELTQPGDLAAALSDPTNGINVESLLHVPSAELGDATAALEGGSVDVLVYFAHQTGPGQPEFTRAVEQHLIRGGGVVVFHHGMYTAGGKEPILELLGVTCSGVLWEETNGQAVVNVAPDHFVTTQGLTLAGSTALEGSALGVQAGSYPSFTNVPDEIYPSTRLLTAEGEERELLFVGISEGGGSGGERVLSYDLRRPEWSGHVIAYQPGEYQPQALDLSGVNFQVLANAIYYTATTQDDPSPSTDESGGASATGEDTTESGADTTGSSSTSTSADEAGGDNDATSDASATGNASSSTETGANDESESADDASDADPAESSADDGVAAGSSESDETAAVSGAASAGCSCSTGAPTPLAPMGLLWMGLGFARRRRLRTPRS